MSKTSAHTRRYFDGRLERLRFTPYEPRPPKGWIRAIRQSLGMSSSELATRMGVGQSTISGLERSELRGSIKLDTLRRAARALDCDLVYYLAPRGTLEDVAMAQARRKAGKDRADDSSFREGDAADLDQSARIDELARDYLDRRGLWTD